jgi:hypothetical protein
MKRPILRAFIAITRVDEDNRVVEGYAAVNEAVAGDKYKLTRSALQSATPDYTTWGAVREMHQPSAVGTCNDNGQTEGLGVEWDDKGAFLRCKIVDEAAWEKVKQGVYKGFSVGVRCDKVERGNEVTACTWVETSLVDRPADPDAKIMAFRFDEADQEPETTRIDAHVAEMDQRGAFADCAKACEKNRLRYAAFDWLNGCLMWPFDEPADPEAYARECIAEFEIYWLSRGLHLYGDDAERTETADLFRTLTAKQTKCGNDDEEPEDEDAKRLARMLEVEAENKDLSARLETAEADLNKERENRNALQVRVSELEAQPRATRPPVKFTGQPVERTFGAEAETAKEAEKLQTELKGIMARAEAREIPENEQVETMKRVSEIKRKLKAEHGIEAA